MHSAKGLTAHSDAVLVLEHLDRERRTEFSVPGPDQLQRVLPKSGAQLVARSQASAFVNQATATVLPKPDQQPANLSHAPELTCSTIKVRTL